MGHSDQYERLKNNVIYLKQVFGNVLVFSFDNLILPNTSVIKMEKNYTGSFYDGNRFYQAMSWMHENPSSKKTSWYFWADDDTVVFPSSLVHHIRESELPLDEHVFQGSCITWRMFAVGG